MRTIDKPLDDTERALLGCLFLQQKLTGALDSRGGARLFRRESHRLIYKAIRELEQAERNVDGITVSEALQAEGVLKECGGAAYVARLTSYVPSAVSWETYVELLQERHTQRELWTLATELKGRVENNENLGDTLAWSSDKMRELLMPKSARTAAEVARAVWDEVAAAVEGKSTPLHSTQLPWLDWMLGGGIAPGHSYYVGGLYKAGKTKLLGLIAQQLLRLGWHVDWWSVEMSAEEMKRRHVARLTGVDESKLITGQMADDDLRKVQAALLGECSGWNLRHFRRGRLPVAEVRAETTAYLLAKSPQRYAVFVDYLQGCTAGALTGHERYAEISETLNGISKETGVPVFVTYQLAPRQVEGRRGRTERLVPMPRPSDARGSTQILMDANELLVVHRPWWEESDWRSRFTVLERQAARSAGAARLYLFADLATSDFRPWTAGIPDPFEAVELPPML